MRTRVVSMVTFLALLVPLAACGSDPKAPTTSAPAGFTVASDDKSGFAIAVPAGWQQIPLSDNLDEFNETANRLRLENPKLATSILQARDLAQKGVGKLVAVRPDGLAKLNLTVDKAKEKNLDEVAETSVTKLLESGATGMDATRPQVAGRPGVRLSFKAAVKVDEGPSVEVDEFIYMVQEGRDAFFLTVIGAESALADTIAGTLRIR